MAFINENLATLGSALAVYIFIRMGAKREAFEIKTEMREEIREVRDELKEIREELKQIDRILTRLEGHFDEH